MRCNGVLGFVFFHINLSFSNPLIRAVRITESLDTGTMDSDLVLSAQSFQHCKVAQWRLPWSDSQWPRKQKTRLAIQPALSLQLRGPS